MEANELRIGNYVQVDLNEDGSILYGKVCTLATEEYESFNGGDECVYESLDKGAYHKFYCADSGFTPIPLTEEILLKCGFGKTADDYIDTQLFIYLLS